ncbi:Hypothetical_protein [Hexamita inflata]|uniref:Hypothetical_protein n=1 Tax=Hexamita inflata TaxID=28002 RepID=A0AA86RS59_9EUKA|nr:Hypothetical protein HINF_LOCUS66308 [Hexamita inflata]
MDKSLNKSSANMNSNTHKQNDAFLSSSLATQQDEQPLQSSNIFCSGDRDQNFSLVHHTIETNMSIQFTDITSRVVVKTVKDFDKLIQQLKHNYTIKNIESERKENELNLGIQFAKLQQVIIEVSPDVISKNHELSREVLKYFLNQREQLKKSK